MTGPSFAVGGILTATGVIAYVTSDSSSTTALIPSALGVLILAAVFISRMPRARRHALHAALAVSVLGIVGTLMNVMRLGDLLAGTAERPNAVIASAVTFVVLVAYLICGITSFLRARRYRTPEQIQVHTPA